MSSNNDNFKYISFNFYTLSIKQEEKETEKIEKKKRRKKEIEIEHKKEEKDIDELIINKLFHPECYFIILLVYGNKLNTQISLYSLIDMNRLLYSKYKLLLDNPQFKRVVENDIFSYKKPISKHEELYHQELKKIYEEPVHLTSRYIKLLFQQMYNGNGLDLLNDIFIKDGFVVLIDDRNLSHVYIENDSSHFTNWINHVYNQPSLIIKIL